MGFIDNATEVRISDAKHLPYRVELTRLSGGEPYASIEGGMGFHGKTNEGFELTGIIDPDEAAFIVRACNSHAAMVAALEMARAELRASAPMTLVPNDDFDTWPSVREIDAALALAKGDAK